MRASQPRYSFLCPTCGKGTNVVDSRPNLKGIYRRRLCELGHRFSTYEIPETDMNKHKNLVARLKDFMGALNELGR